MCVCMCVHVGGLGCVCAYVCRCATGAQCQSECTNRGPEGETQAGSGSGLVVMRGVGCPPPFPVSFPFLSVGEWRFMEIATLSTRCFFFKISKV